MVLVRYPTRRRIARAVAPVPGFPAPAWWHAPEPGLPPTPRASMTHAAPPKTRRSPSQSPVDSRFDWRRIAYNVLASRALDDLEETTNRNRTSVPREHLILYQFSSRGHDLGQTILGTLLDHPHDAAGAYYRCRPLLVTMGLSLEDALGSPLGRAGGFSDGRDIGVVGNMPGKGGATVLPMAGDVGSQYTPAAG